MSLRLVWFRKVNIHIRYVFFFLIVEEQILAKIIFVFWQRERPWGPSAEGALGISQWNGPHEKGPGWWASWTILLGRVSPPRWITRTLSSPSAGREYLGTFPRWYRLEIDVNWRTEGEKKLQVNRGISVDKILSSVLLLDGWIMTWQWILVLENFEWPISSGDSWLPSTLS